MSASTCFYDCSQPPRELTPNPDISGIGVSSICSFHSCRHSNNAYKIALANTVTTSLAVLIVIAYFVCAYQPHDDPFDGAAGENGPRSRTSFKANGLDIGILGISRRWKFKRFKFNDGVSRPLSRVHIAITKASTATQRNSSVYKHRTDNLNSAC